MMGRERTVQNDVTTQDSSQTSSQSKTPTLRSALNYSKLLFLFWNFGCGVMSPLKNYVHVQSFCRFIWRKSLICMIYLLQ